MGERQIFPMHTNNTDTTITPFPDWLFLYGSAGGVLKLSVMLCLFKPDNGALKKKGSANALPEFREENTKSQEGIM
ncbi:hypothetical protein JCM17843_12080 [Kordiimonadales bacterium JCM 17843]|nr:hypothetical protein JCM17843_12080 [Kordiimonadales bacterium JCM 17843]